MYMYTVQLLQRPDLDFHINIYSMLSLDIHVQADNGTLFPFFSTIIKINKFVSKLQYR